MRVIFPLINDSLGGAQLSTIIIAKTLIAANVPVSIVLHRAEGPVAKYLDSSKLSYQVIEAYDFPGTKPSYMHALCRLLNVLPKLIAFLYLNKFSIVHGNDLRINLAWSIAAKLVGLPFVWHQRSILNSALVRWYSLIVSDIIFFPNKSSLLRSGYGRYRSMCRVVKSPVDYDEIIVKEQQDVTKNSEKIVRLGYFGSVKDGKNINILADYFEYSSQTLDCKLELHIFGYQQEHYVKHGIVNSSNVIYHEYCYDVYEQMQGVDILVTTSLAEAFPRTMIEAQIVRIPMLAPNVTPYDEILENGVNGFLFDPGSAADFVSKLSKLIGMIMKNHCFTFRAVKDHAPEKVAMRLLSFYSKLN
jgi:glycosyltransferase involved in cell wall biosynthesis